jgi:hypothetical protein
MFSPAIWRLELEADRVYSRFCVNSPVYWVLLMFPPVIWRLQLEADRVYSRFCVNSPGYWVLSDVLSGYMAAGT